VFDVSGAGDTTAISVLAGRPGRRANSAEAAELANRASAIAGRQAGDRTPALADELSRRFEPRMKIAPRRVHSTATAP
jgi:bifunctional ADP-heptose synthase (sugar kinase/adenylyltransferase)